MEKLTVKQGKGEEREQRGQVKCPLFSGTMMLHWVSCPQNCCLTLLLGSEMRSSLEEKRVFGRQEQSQA